MLKNFASGCVVRSEHCLDILNAKSVGKEHFNVFITERSIEKTASFWYPVKKFRRSHQMCSIKKPFLKFPQCSQENTCDRVSFHLC